MSRRSRGRVPAIAAVAAATLGGVAALGGAAHADGQVSFDVQGLYASSPLPHSTLESAHQAALVQSGSSSSGTGVARPGDGIVGAELRPTFSFGRGLRVAVGFRAGKTVGDESNGSTASMMGGDLGLGYQRWAGRLLPFGEVRFGFNAYEISNGPVTEHAEQLRLDAVLGTRLYLGEALYLSAAAFGGWGDRYGGTLGLGFDVVRYRRRGALP